MWHSDDRKTSQEKTVQGVENASVCIDICAVKHIHCM